MGYLLIVKQKNNYYKFKIAIRANKKYQKINNRSLWHMKMTLVILFQFMINLKNSKFFKKKIGIKLFNKIV